MKRASLPRSRPCVGSATRRQDDHSLASGTARRQSRSKYSLRPSRRASANGSARGRVRRRLRGPAAVAASHAVPDGGFVLFENVRFHARKRRTIRHSRANSRRARSYVTMPSARRIARTHRPSASRAICRPMRLAHGSRARRAHQTHGEPGKPFVCAIGGAKVADKVGVFENLLARSARS